MSRDEQFWGKRNEVSGHYGQTLNIIIMCDTCGCESTNNITIKKPGEAHSHMHIHPGKGAAHTHSHDHGHGHQHAHDQHHTHEHEKVINVEQDVLQKNNLLAERNRGYFEARNILAINMVSSPGSGKTSLLERTINDMKNDTGFYVIEGDQQTMNDANRIEGTGAPVVQVNTGSGCHLDANMVNNAIKQLDIKEQAVLMIENVGNLVCPSMFDLGEKHRVVIFSTTEGEDKPLKYPDMFASSDICIINKTDLLPYVDFDMKKAREYALQVNSHLKIFELSAKTGDGLDKWYEWLKSKF